MEQYFIIINLNKIKFLVLFKKYLKLLPEKELLGQRNYNNFVLKALKP